MKESWILKIPSVSTFGNTLVRTRKIFKSFMGYDMETVKSFDIPETITYRYPPCYIVHAKDDSTVPCKNSTELKKLLDEHHIPVKLELIEHGGHGWGDGSGTEAAGWPDSAAAFMEQLE